jgi:hypothetical protein
VAQQNPRTAPSPVPSKTRTVTIEVYQGGRKVESTFQNPDAPPVWEAK